jgi:Animal haem peroxidase
MISSSPKVIQARASAATSSEVDSTRDRAILDPSPPLVSNKLLARPTNKDGTDGFVWASGKMLVRRTRRDPTRKLNDSAGPETFVNAETYWWDSSQIYGNSSHALIKYRAKDRNGNPRDGKLDVDENDMIKLDPTGIEKTGLTSTGGSAEPAAQHLHARA